MNELLTSGIGHTEFRDSELGRVPRSWEIKELRDIGRFSKGKGIPKNSIQTTGIPCVRYAEIYTEYDEVIKKFKSFISEETATSSRKLNKGDIIFAGSGETAEEIGKSTAFVNDFEAYVSSDAIVFSPAVEIDSIFLSCQLNGASVRKMLNKWGQGSSIIHIYSSFLENIKICIPPLPEQEKISTFFTFHDSRAKAARQKLNQTQSLKKSLMQDLLTGRVRVST